MPNKMPLKENSNSTTRLSQTEHPIQGILVVNKPKDKTSFSLVAALRRILSVKKIGHAGTLDPFATGVMVMLIGREYTKLSDQFLTSNKEYIAKLKLGIATDSYDCDGEEVSRSDTVPTLEQIEEALSQFQGKIQQVPPMFSAKKINGKRLYELARKGKTVEREAVTVEVETELLSYEYPFLEIKIRCSKGTYIRSIAHDLGQMVGSGAHLVELQRTKSGTFALDSCVDGAQLFTQPCDPSSLLPRLLKL